MKYKIHGKIFQNVEFVLNEGDAILAEPGKLIWMDDRVGMDTAIHGGIIEGIKRKLGGERFMVTKFYGKSDNAHLVLKGEMAGEIIPLNIGEQEVIARLKAFVAGEPSVKVSPHFIPSIGYSISTGKHTFQKLSGDGMAFISGSGEMTTVILKNNTIYASLASIVAYDSSVNLSIAPVPGIKNMLFADAGIIMARLSGSGRVVLQNF